MYRIRKSTRYRTPLIVAAGILVALGVVVLLLTRPVADNPQAIDGPPTQISEPQPTALVAVASECGSEVIVAASHESGESSLIVVDGQVSAGERLTMPIVLSQAPAGLAGYDVRLNVDDPSIARIAGIDFPNFGLVREVEASEQRVRIAAADLQRVVESGDIDSTLATVTVEGKQKGATFIQLSIVQMDDDSGDPMTPQVFSGTLTVC